jgi:hypothetical protein
MRAASISIPRLDLAAAFVPPPDPRERTYGSSISLSKGYDPSFKESLRKRVVLPDRSRPLLPANPTDRCTEAVS